MKSTRLGILIVIVLLVGFFVWWRLAKPAEPSANPTASDFTNTLTSTGKQPDTGQYQWSSMSQGPYRDNISFATSTDLQTWTDSGQTLAEHASVPGAVMKDGTIFVYFVDVHQDGKPEQLGLITSKDNGKTWSDPKILTIKNIEKRVVADPDPVLLADGRIRLYYFDINDNRINGPDATFKIESAISNDGEHFTQEDGIRFERPAAAGGVDPDVELIDGTWYLYVGSVGGNTVVGATSKDGMTFTEAGPVYSEGAVPDVVQAGDGQFYLFTAGINYAVSQTPLFFFQPSGSFHSSLGKVTADPSVVQLPDGTYLMLFKYQL